MCSQEQSHEQHTTRQRMPATQPLILQPLRLLAHSISRATWHLPHCGAFCGLSLSQTVIMWSQDLQWEGGPLPSLLSFLMPPAGHFLHHVRAFFTATVARSFCHSSLTSMTAFCLEGQWTAGMGDPRQTTFTSPSPLRRPSPIAVPMYT